MTTNAVNTINSLLQLVSTNITGVVTCNVALPRDNSIPQNTEGVEVATLAITPIYADSTLEISFYGAVTKDANAGSIQTALFQDATAGALAASYTDMIASIGIDAGLVHTMASGTTASTTFKIRIGPAANSCYLNGDNAANRLMGGVANARLIIKEYR